MPNKNFERIVVYLSDERCPKTANEISRWTGISLSEVYEILLSNNVFEQIFDGDSLKGWIVDTMIVSNISQATPFAYNCCWR